LSTLEQESGSAVPGGGSVARAIRYTVPAAVSLALLGFLVWRFEGWDALRRVDLLLLLFGVLSALVLDCGLAAVKWWWVTRMLGLRVPLRRVWLTLVAMMPLSFFMPFQSGHAFSAVALARVEGVGLFVAAESVLLDKGTSLVALFALAALGQVLLPDGHPLQHDWILVLALLPLGGLLFMGPILGLLGRFAFVRERSQLLRHPLTWDRKLGLLGISMVCQASEVVSMIIACAALGLAVDPVVILAGFPAVSLIALVPITVNGFGLRESLTISFLALTHVLPEDSVFDAGVSTGFLVDLLEYIGPAIFGLVALPWLVRRLWRPR